MDAKNKISAKYVEPSQLDHWRAEIKAKELSIVSLNGSFDLMHAGHLKILQEAASQGDILIVALNTDASIQRYKGPKRPIISLKDRLEMMASIAYVDFVTYFDEDDPRVILSHIQPDIHVNGSEYGPMCIEAETVKEHGGKIYIVELKPGLSTSKIMNTIKQICES